MQPTYRQVSCLKKSEQCEIWLAEAAAHDQVVIRCYDNQPIMQKVYNKLQQVKSPYLPTVYEQWQTETGFSVVEEYIDGVPLSDILAGGKRFNVQEARFIGIQLCKALQPLHQLNIIHRDIKPGNILLCKDGTIRLIDFGAARFYQTTQSKDTRLLGTEGYAAPEQYGFAQTDKRADIYGIGATLHELITGEVPAGAVSSQCGNLCKVVKRCIAFNPSHRYATIDKLLQALIKKRYYAQKIALLAVALIFCLAGDIEEDCRWPFVHNYVPTAEDIAWQEAEFQRILDTDHYESGIFEGRPLDMIEVVEGFPILQDIPLSPRGFHTLVTTPIVAEQFKIALGTHYDNLMDYDVVGLPYLLSYDQTNQTYYAEAGWGAWEITQYGAVRMAFQNYRIVGDPLDQDVMVFTNSIYQRAGHEMAYWIENAQRSTDNTRALVDQMEEVMG